MPEGQLCIACKSSPASFRCLECGPLSYFSFECLSKSHTSQSLRVFHSFLLLSLWTTCHINGSRSTVAINCCQSKTGIHFWASGLSWNPPVQVSGSSERHLGCSAVQMFSHCRYPVNWVFYGLFMMWPLCSTAKKCLPGFYWLIWGVQV